MSDISIAVLTDVHGNAFAVEAVAKDIHAQQPDLILNLGDQIWGQADPVRALDIQRSLGATEVRGNNDERLTSDPALLSPNYAALQKWLAEQMPAAELHRLATLPTSATVADGAVLAAHGTPTTPWDSLLIGWDGQQDYFRRPEAEILERLNVPPETQVVLVGHMHREDVREVAGRLLVTVGPVSSQADGDARARWTHLTRRSGQWRAEARRVVYDCDAATAWEKQYGVIEPINHATPPNFAMRDG